MLRKFIWFFLLFNGLVYALHDDLRFIQYDQQSPIQQKLSSAFSQIIKNPPVPLSAVQEKPILVYFINPTRQISDYWRRNKIAFAQRLSELGIKNTVKSHDIKVKSNEDQKRKLLERVLANDPDFVILTLDTAPETVFIEQLMMNHRDTRLIIENVTNPVKKWHSNQPLIYVGFSHEKGTKMLADYFTQTFSENAQFAVNNYYPGYISELRGKAFVTMLEENENTNFKMLSHIYTDATQGSADHHTRKLVTKYPKLDFIYASSTDIAIGTSNALKKIGRTDIKVNGWGGGSAELQAIRKGELDVTVMRMNDDNGIAMAEAIKLVIEEKEDLIPLVYSGEFKLVTSKTPPAELNQFIGYAFRYSGRQTNNETVATHSK